MVPLSFPPVFPQGDLQCSLQFQSTRAKNRDLALPGCSTSHHTSTRALARSLLISKMHQEAGTLAGKMIPCSRISGARVLLQASPRLPAAPSEDEDLRWARGSWGGSCSGGAACLSAFPSSHACPAAGTAASGANCWVRSAQLALA